MTEQGQQVAAIWPDADFARDWAEGDAFRDLLDFPRRMAAVIVAGDNPAARAPSSTSAAGPGALLAVFLEQFPPARGIWTDASRPMLDLAPETSSRRSATGSTTASPT